MKVLERRVLKNMKMLERRVLKNLKVVVEVFVDLFQFAYRMKRSVDNAVLYYALSSTYAH